MLKTLQNTDYPFSIQLIKKKTNEARFLSGKLNPIRQMILQSLVIHSLKRERGHSDSLSRYHGPALDSKCWLVHIYY